MTSNRSYLDIVDLFSLEVGVISIIISYTSEEFDISKELATVTLPKLKISDDKVVIIDIFHGYCGCGSVECALIFVCVEDFQSQIDSFSVEYFLVNNSATILCLDGFLTQVYTLHNHHSPVYQLVTGEHVERATHKEVVIGRSCYRETILE